MKSSGLEFTAFPTTPSAAPVADYEVANRKFVLNNAGMTNPMTTAGDIIYGGTAGAPIRLAKGTASQVIKMNSGATAPEWGDASQFINTLVITTNDTILYNVPLEDELIDSDAYVYKLLLFAKQADGSVGDALYQVKIKREGDTTSLSGTVRTILAWEGDTNLGTPTISITANDTTNKLNISITPSNSTLTKWHIAVEYVKINY